MRTFVFFLIGMGFIALQTTIFQNLPEWVGVPDLLFLLIIFMAINLRVSQGAILTLIFGTGIEAFSGYFLGLYALAYLLIFFIVKALAVGLAINEANFQPPIVAIGYLLANGLVYLFSAMLEDGQGAWVWGGILQRVLIIIILVVPVNRFFSIVSDIFERKTDSQVIFRRSKGNRYKSY